MNTFVSNASAGVLQRAVDAMRMRPNRVWPEKMASYSRTMMGLGTRAADPAQPCVSTWCPLGALFGASLALACLLTYY